MNFDFHLDRPLLFLAALLVLGVWTFWIYARTHPSPPPVARRTLITLRLAASLLLALMLGGWSLEWTRRHSEPPGLILLVDASASMSLPREAGDPQGLTRYAAALEIAAALEDEPGIRVRSFAFGEGLLAGPLPKSPGAGFTDLGRALSDLPTLGAGAKLLLLSDGQDRGTSLRFQETRLPVMAVLLGDSVPQPDLRIGATRAPSVLPRGRQGKLRTEIQSVQGAPRRGLLRLSEEGRLLQEQEWSMDEGPGRIEIEFPLLFEEEGRRELTLELSAEGEDLRPENNRRVISLDVLDEELEILVVAGRPDWDLPFLMDALRAEEQLSVRLVIAGPGGIARDAESGDPWLGNEGAPDGLVLHSLLPGWMELFARVDPGGLFLFPAALGEVGWPDDWGLLPAGAATTRGEIPLEWAPEAFRHEALGELEALGPGLTPPPDLESLSDLNASGLRAILLSGDRPVLALRNWSGRRQALLAGAGLYRWSLSGEDGREALAALYSGTIRWLARPDPPGRIRILPAEDAAREGRPLEIRAELFDVEYRRLESGNLRWALHRDGNLVASGLFVAPVREGDDFKAGLPALPSGEYEIEMEARLPGGEILEETKVLAVLPDAGEFARGESSPATLRWLAAESGGQFFPEPDLEAIRDALPRQPSISERRRSLRVWDHPLIFLLFLGLLAAEWGLRKRHGLV